MNKQQFIEKSLNKILTSKYTIALALALPTEVYDDFIKEIAKVIHLQLSECWDMAGEELIDKVDLEIEAWMGANQNLDREFTTHEMMKHLRNTALTSQKEGKGK